MSQIFDIIALIIATPSFKNKLFTRTKHHMDSILRYILDRRLASEAHLVKSRGVKIYIVLQCIAIEYN